MSGERNPALYRTIKDVLKRRAETTTVTYEPDSIQRRYLAAEIDPMRVVPATGPESPTLTVRWKTAPPHERFRIDYADPNTGFHCGWHRDDDHPELGPIHFQLQHSGTEEPRREPARFEVDTPTRILWACLDRLFGEVFPDRSE